VAKKQDDDTPDWPLGAEIERAVKRIGSRKEAARLAGVSDTLLSNLERGYEVKGGHRIPVNPKPLTILSVAQGLGIGARRALEMAGLPTDVLDQPVEEPEEYEAYVAAQRLWASFERSVGKKAADAALYRLYWSRHGTPNDSADRDAG
jgi:transcriptional regulator with XRE-family HTH domain